MNMSKQRRTFVLGNLIFLLLITFLLWNIASVSASDERENIQQRQTKIAKLAQLTLGSQELFQQVQLQTPIFQEVQDPQIPKRVYPQLLQYLQQGKEKALAGLAQWQDLQALHYHLSMVQSKLSLSKVRLKLLQQKLARTEDLTPPRQVLIKQWLEQLQQMEQQTQVPPSQQPQQRVLGLCAAADNLQGEVNYFLQQDFPAENSDNFFAHLLSQAQLLQKATCSVLNRIENTTFLKEKIQQLKDQLSQWQQSQKKLVDLQRSEPTPTPTPTPYQESLQKMQQQVLDIVQLLLDIDRGLNRGTIPTTENLFTTKTFFGDNDLQLLDVGSLLKSQFARSVGNLLQVYPDPESPSGEFRAPVCTAIQVGPRLILTAGHCREGQLVFTKARVADAKDIKNYEVWTMEDYLRIEFLGELAQEEQVLEAQQKQIKSLENKIESKVTKIVDYDPVADVALLELESTPIGTYLDLSYWRQCSFVAATTATVPLELYSFPNGLPLSRTYQCSGQLWNDEELGVQWLKHDCDSSTGSSGGLLVDSAHQCAVGVHLAGPVNNSGEFYKKQGRFETVQEVGAKKGCINDESYTTCLVQRGMNKGLAAHHIVQMLEQLESAVE